MIIVCGLNKEAQLIEKAGGGNHLIVGGGDVSRLEARLEKLARAYPEIILSSGIAGALDPALDIGNVVIDGDPAVIAVLKRAIPIAICGGIVGRDGGSFTISDKHDLRRATGAVAVDMESHIAARVAARHGLRFAALRTISDRADETLPPAALVGMKPDGGMALGAVLASLARHPAQLPALIRTGLHAGRAFAALGRAHHALGRFRVELADLGQLRLDMT